MSCWFIISGSVVKSLFNGLKKEYSNQRCLYESRLENGDPANIPEPTWIFWKPLSFLREKMAKRKRIPRSIPASFASKIARYINFLIWYYVQKQGWLVRCSDTNFCKPCSQMIPHLAFSFDIYYRRFSNATMHTP
jgi:hypothetical protein